MQDQDFDNFLLSGFEGYVPFSTLRREPDLVPDQPGVYAVIRTDPNPPIFIGIGTGGYHKQKDPNVSAEILQDNWVANTRILYFGKAGQMGSKRTLRKRIREYSEFGLGKPVGHRGGRLIWQLGKAELLEVAWRTVADDPRKLKSQLVAEFQAHNRKRPFANLRS